MSRSGDRSSTDQLRRQQVRARYGGIATDGGGCCTPGTADDCCTGGAGSSGGDSSSVALQLGYTAEQLSMLPEGANLGLGCGNPTALRSLRPRQIVLDLGSGAGIDCFLAARQVGPKGHVIGVDMTPEMVAKARDHARVGKFANVEFRLGEIEHLPVADRSVDVVVSNCVINLVPEKGAVYREAFRVLRPGGHLAISDVVATRPISEKDRADPSRWSACSSGAIGVRQLRRLLRQTGFTDVQVDVPVRESPPDTLRESARVGALPATIRATRPRTARR
jgi:arsenite methyltransferase